MYTDIPLWLSLVFMAVGLAALAWSSDLFIDGSAAIARMFGVSPFIIGMVIIGFGTSAPELCVSAMSGMSGHSDLSLGNAYGSCIFNIAVILGVGALILPIAVKPSVAFIAGPGLAALALFSLWLVGDGICTRIGAFALLAAFALIMPLYCWYDQKTKKGAEAMESVAEEQVTRGKLLVSVLKLAIGLAALISSSHILVWGAVDFAKFMHVSDLVIGLTIVAVGTSLPELASAVASARRGEHEFVLGNIVGSNLFNTLAVVGIATAISPLYPGEDGTPAFSRYIITRDLPMMVALSLSITLFGMNWRNPLATGSIGRGKAVLWLITFVIYAVVMFWQEVSGL